MTNFGVASRETSYRVTKRYADQGSFASNQLFETPATYNILDYLNCYMKISVINTMNAVRRSLKNCSNFVIIIIMTLKL